MTIAPNGVRMVLAGGFLAGAFDLLFAIGFWALKANVPATRILQSVAAGLFGKSSFDGGWTTAGIGLALHFFIAVVMSFAYYLGATKWPPLWAHPFWFGSLYGLGAYLTMNYVVIPLSAAQPGSRDPLWVGLSIAVHVFLIGIPIALSTRRVFTKVW